MVSRVASRTRFCISRRIRGRLCMSCTSGSRRLSMTWPMRSRSSSDRASSCSAVNGVAVLHRRERETLRRAQQRDVLVGRHLAQGLQRLALALLVFLLDGLDARAVFLAFEAQLDGLAQLADEALHGGAQPAALAGRAGSARAACWGRRSCGRSTSRPVPPAAAHVPATGRARHRGGRCRGGPARTGCSRARRCPAPAPPRRRRAPGRTAAPASGRAWVVSKSNWPGSQRVHSSSTRSIPSGRGQGDVESAGGASPRFTATPSARGRPRR